MNMVHERMNKYELMDGKTQALTPTGDCLAHCQRDEQ